MYSFSAFRTPSHLGASWGLAYLFFGKIINNFQTGTFWLFFWKIHLRSPTGGFAYGIPKKDAMGLF